MYALFPVYPLQCGKCGGGDFSVGGARLCFRIPENPCSPRPVVAERANPLPPVADSGMKEIRTKKKKHMTKDVNGRVERLVTAFEDSVRNRIRNHEMAAYKDSLAHRLFREAQEIRKQVDNPNSK